MTLLSVGGGSAMGQGTGGISGGGGTSSGHPYVFPLPTGKHTYGDGFGVRRAGHRHQGQDLLIKCGKPVVAVHKGKIQMRKYQSAAGYYLVLDPSGTGVDFAYMHLRKGSILVHKGDRVKVGQRLASVGKTGDATACHLHFEKWTAPGWYQGGHAVNPTPNLKAWDKYS